MTNRFPIIYNPNANQLQEIASGDNLDLSGNNIINLVGIAATNINVVGVVTATTFIGTLTGNVDATTVDTDNLNIGTQSVSNTTTTSLSTLSATTIDSFATASFRSARVQVQITQSTNYQTSDVLIIHNGTTADLVEYGSIATNDYLGTFSAIVSGGNCLLQINMSSATSSTVKVLSQRITI
jgi:hypothetical protein